MAHVIGDDCISCGSCEAECPDFEQTLDGAVLAVRPVQHGEHRVHMAERGQRTVNAAQCPVGAISEA